MFAFALRNLATRPLRTLLALCGLTVAILGMVGLFSVAEGIDAMVDSTFGRIPGLIVMQPGAPIPLFSRLPASWGDEIRRVPGVAVVSPEVWSRAHVVEGKPTISPPRFLFGVDIAQVLKLRRGVYREAVQQGRFLEAGDQGTTNAVISRAIADEFKKTVGDDLVVDGQVLKIVGIYHCGSLLLDVAILFDAARVRSMARIGEDTVSNFYVELESDNDRGRLEAEIKALFRGRTPDAWQPTGLAALAAGGEAPERRPVEAFFSRLHRALSTPAAGGSAKRPAAAAASKPPAMPLVAAARSPELPVEVRSAADWAEEFKRFSADLDIFLLVMTGIGMTIAVLGIINTMLMSVTERFIEFGILKANGWSQGDVLKLILYESGVLGLTGGVAGAALGWAATQAINANWPTRVHLYAGPRLLLFSVGFSTLVGVLGGLYPAHRAARLLPMEAIRRST